MWTYQTIYTWSKSTTKHYNEIWNISQKMNPEPKIRGFAKIVYGWKQLTIFAKKTLS